LVRVLLQQLLQGLMALQAQGISHRDVKPENLLVRDLTGANSSSSSSSGGGSSSSGREKRSGGGCKLLAAADLHLRLIDFGSAVDAHSVASGLYGPLGRGPTSSSNSSTNSSSSGGSSGPSVDELTMEYAAPEVLFSSR
jgi:serine/threonine protein kinase